MTTASSCITEGINSPITCEIMLQYRYIKYIVLRIRSQPSDCRTAFAIQYGKEMIVQFPNPSVQIGQSKMSNIDIQKIKKVL